MYKLLQQKENDKQYSVQPKGCQRFKNGRITFVQKLAGNKIKTQYPLIFTIVCNSGNALK